LPITPGVKSKKQSRTNPQFLKEEKRRYLGIVNWILFGIWCYWFGISDFTTPIF
jgi:hypothetical protein